jgi:hypothetical protein
MKTIYVRINGSVMKVKVRNRDLAKLQRDQAALRAAIMAKARQLPWYRRVWFALFPPKQLQQAKPGAAVRVAPQGASPATLAIHRTGTPGPAAEAGK